LKASQYGTLSLILGRELAIILLLKTLPVYLQYYFTFFFFFFFFPCSHSHHPITGIFRDTKSGAMLAQILERKSKFRPVVQQEDLQHKRGPRPSRLSTTGEEEKKNETNKK